MRFILQKVLNKKRVSQYRLAKMLGMTHGEVHRLCQEDYNPTLKTALRVADALDVGLDEMVARGKRSKRYKR